MGITSNQRKKVYPFNNGIETGLRTLSVLNASFPMSYDIGLLVYFDYLTVHSGDVEGGLASLHPAVPNRSGEIFVRRTIIEDGLDLLISKNLVEKIYTSNGIEYRATEQSTPFLESLSENYTLELIRRAEWVISKFSSYTESDFREFMEKNAKKLKNEFNLEILR
jgi:hypothetical protein